MTKASPSMPTPRQIREAWQTANELEPDPRRRIGRIGPNGVEFVYPSEATSGDDRWKGKPFGDAT